MQTNDHRPWSWLMLFSRLVLFLVIQGVFALSYYWAGRNQPWENAANWWPIVVTLTNLICIFLLIRLFRVDGRSYWDIFRVERDKIGKDLLVMLGVLVVVAPVSYLPNVTLGKWLFGDPQVGLNFLLRPLPYWAAFTGMLTFPITQGLVEIPTYFMYVMPQFEKKGLPRWLALGLPVLFLALQHIAVPFLFNLHYLIWRALMFLPFALLVGIVIRWRPRLLPYLAVIHILMDISFSVMLLQIAY